MGSSTWSARKRVAPNNPDISKLAGWAYYGMNKLNQAVAEWQRSLELRPDSEVQAALDKALRDKREEENYRENESSHFSCATAVRRSPAWRTKCFALWKRILPPSSRN